MITCPGSSCQIIVEDESIFELIEDDLDTKIKYQEMIIKTCVESNPMLKWCPAPSCTYAIRRIIKNPDQNISVQCICGHEFCFQCSENFHDPSIIRSGSCTSELQLKVKCRPKVNGRIKFGLAWPTIGRLAQFCS